MAFAPEDPAFIAGPYPAIAELREGPAAVYDEASDHWLVPRWADVNRILRDRRFRDGLVEAPPSFTYFVLFNALGGPVTADPAVRQALAGVVRARDLVWQNAHPELSRLAQQEARARGRAKSWDWGSAFTLMDSRGGAESEEIWEDELGSHEVLITDRCALRERQVALQGESP